MGFHRHIGNNREIPGEEDESWNVRSGRIRVLGQRIALLGMACVVLEIGGQSALNGGYTLPTQTKGLDATL